MNLFRAVAEFFLPQSAKAASDADMDARYGFGRVVERPMPPWPDHILHDHGVRAQSAQEYAARYPAAVRKEFAPEFRCLRDEHGRFIRDCNAPRDGRGRFV